MAILNSIPGLAVSVAVAANELPEYECRDEEPQGPFANKTVLRYIESVSDAEFVIKFQISPPFQLGCAALHFKVCIDGHPVKGTICKNSRVKHGHWARALSGDRTALEDGRGELRKFKFASIKTGNVTSGRLGPTYHLFQVIVEDADSLRIMSDAVKFSLVGQITIKVYRVSDVRKNDRVSHDRFEAKAGLEVAEKAMKGKSLSHCTA